METERDLDLIDEGKVAFLDWLPTDDREIAVADEDSERDEALHLCRFGGGKVLECAGDDTEEGGGVVPRKLPARLTSLDRKASGVSSMSTTHDTESLFSTTAFTLGDAGGETSRSSTKAERPTGLEFEERSEPLATWDLPADKGLGGGLLLRS